MQSANSISIVEMFSEIAVALHEHRQSPSGESTHLSRMSLMFTEIETALAELDPADWTPGRYFDVATDTLLRMKGSEPKLYAAAFRRPGTALMRRKELGIEEFGTVFTTMASGFRDNMTEHPNGGIIAQAWEKAADAYMAAKKQDHQLPECMRAASAAARDFVGETKEDRPYAVSSSLIIRAMSDAMN